MFYTNWQFDPMNFHEYQLLQGTGSKSFDSDDNFPGQRCNNIDEIIPHQHVISPKLKIPAKLIMTKNKQRHRLWPTCLRMAYLKNLEICMSQSLQNLQNWMLCLQDKTISQWFFYINRVLVLLCYSCMKGCGQLMRRVSGHVIDMSAYQNYKSTFAVLSFSYQRHKNKYHC